MPRLDEAVLERLGHALDRESVVAALLIGIASAWEPGPLDDLREFAASLERLADSNDSTTDSGT